MSRFVDAAHHFFDPVARIADMTCVIETATQVRYENQSVFMKIVFDARRSYEISVVIGELSPPPKGLQFDLMDALRMQVYPSSPELREVRGEDQSALTIGLEKLAGLTREHAVGLLKHDQEYFLEVATFRQWASLKYAWETNKQKSVVAAYGGLTKSPDYEALKSQLESADLAILEMARKLSEDEQ